ncbi:MAG: hypothetical protein PVH62_03515 [Anaerolineae bacterium]|jgi:hypothetical protein
MTQSDERVRILKLIQDGQVTADEGAEMLDALKESRREEARPSSRSKLRIRVSNLKTGQAKVDINLPWSLVNAGMKMGARFAGNEIKLEDFMEAVQAGAAGKIVEVLDEEDNERVEIFVE